MMPVASCSNRTYWIQVMYTHLSKNRNKIRLTCLLLIRNGYFAV